MNCKIDESYLDDVLTLEAKKYAFDMNVVNDLQDCELSIMYYVSGYVTRQINNRITCEYSN